METLTYTLVDDEGWEEDISVPYLWEICGRCEGHGKHVNPNIDGHGITQEEWDRDWSEEEKEGYRNGAYDITCNECKGIGKVKAPNYESMTPELARQVKEHLEDKARWDAEDRATYRMESGGYDS